MKSLFTESLAFFESELFNDVQLSGLYPDSKTFADAIPKSSYHDVVQLYDRQKSNHNFNLSGFTAEHFKLVEPVELTQSYKSENILQYIELLWDVLKKPADNRLSSSLLPLDKPYFIPGGRFQEIYYWDSYFSAIGLMYSNRESLVEDMLDNLVTLQESIGVIPNGNRSYYYSRSQPPLLSLLVMLVANNKNNKVKFISQYIDAIMAEYSFWMDGAEKLSESCLSYQRVIKMPDGSILNRYWDNQATPRPESYKEDVELARSLTNTQKAEFYRHIRAACESGWDFSSRWLEISNSLESIQTTNIVPVDLNCLMYIQEKNLSECFALLGKYKQQMIFEEKAKNRKLAINRHLWCSKQKFYFDYNIKRQHLSNVCSIAASLPLFSKIADSSQANSVAEYIAANFLQKGGVVTTLNKTDQQWDAPNGWAPLQWFTVEGLKNYQHNKLAQDIALRWNYTVETIFNRTGKIMEKYNVCNPSNIATGGEYEVQEGFGWTNGVFLDFYHFLHRSKSE